MAHKLPRIASGDSSTEDLREEQERNVGSIEDRQHDRSCLYQQQGGTVSKELVSLTLDLWMWCLEGNIHIQGHLDRLTSPSWIHQE